MLLYVLYTDCYTGILYFKDLHSCNILFIDIVCQAFKEGGCNIQVVEYRLIILMGYVVPENGH